ncbi:MAG: Gfo/Idh/MocA family protein [Christensenellales bacterium]|jgi:scyllo-inositol 2-dehydrogenase (NADP+)
MSIHMAGIIGYGGMGRNHHCSIVHPNILYTAAYDVDPMRLAVAQKDGLVPCQTLEELLTMKDIELILVATPNHVHLELVLAALAAGKHVICEKPAALNSVDLARMYEAAEKAGKLFTIHQNRRWDRDYQIISQVVASGQLGKLFRIESRVQGARGIADTWRRYARFGGGMLYDWGVHLIDQLLLLTNSSITGVFAECQYLNQQEVDENVRLTLFFKNDMSALVEIGTCNFQMLPRWYVCGKEGTTLIPYWDCQGETIVSSGEEIPWEDEIKTVSVMGPSRTLQPRGENTIRHLPLPVADGICGFYEQMTHALEGRNEVPVTRVQAERVMRVIDLAFVSARKGQIINIEEGF